MHTLKKEINYLIKCIKDNKKNVDIKEDNLETMEEQLKNLDKQLKNLDKKFKDLEGYYNIKTKKIKISSIEEVENQINTLYNVKKTPSEKYFEKLNGFVTSRKCVFLWENEKIDEFFTSLMK